MMPGLSLKVSQSLTLTPQLQQSIRLLQLSTQELQQEVEQMLDENPFLERAEDEADAPAEREPAANEAASDFVADGAYESSATAEFDTEPVAEVSAEALPWEGDDGRDTAAEDWGGDMPARGAGTDDEDYSALDHTHAHESLQDVLHRQALALRLSAEDRAALYFLIESLTDDGYLEESLAELAEGLVDASDAEALDEALHHLTVALRLLQSLDPVGVGARNLQECLVLQLKALQRAQAGPAEALETALLVCHESLDLLARRDVRKLVQLTGCKEAAVREAMALIAGLEPRPGRPYANVERNVIVPDVIVRPAAATRAGQPQWRVQLNPEVMPKLRVHDVYASALRGHKGGHAGMQQRLQEARWFIKNIQQRFDTILRVSQAI
ncbi:MAG: RNA polymerase factor sigma-54, partial [Comamonas sp.]